MQSVQKLQVLGSGLATARILSEFIFDLLAFAQIAAARAFHSTDVNESVVAAIIRLDKAKALLGIEPLYGSCRHIVFLPNIVWSARTLRAVDIELSGEMIMNLGRAGPAQGQHVWPSIDWMEHKSCLGKVQVYSKIYLSSIV